MKSTQSCSILAFVFGPCITYLDAHMFYLIIEGSNWFEVLEVNWTLTKGLPAS